MDKKERKELVNDIVDALKEHPHVCRFNISDDDVDKITGHMAGIKMLGHGDITDGFNEMQENHRFIQNQRRFSDSVIRKLAFVIVGVVGLGTMYALWEGFKHFVTEVP
jgi:hypothetical protein